MEDEHPSPGMEDGTIDVEGMLVEPQDRHLSMDSVICFDEKIPKNAMDIEAVSRSSGGPDTGIAQEGKDILNGEVLNAMPSDAEVGYFRLESDFCSMGEEYLLGVEFAESITNLDYGLSEGLQASASNCQIQVSTDGSDTGCRSDLFRTVDLGECQNDQINDRSSRFSDTHIRHDYETLDAENPTISPRSCTLQNSGKSQNSSSSSFLDALSDENDGRFSQAGQTFSSSKTGRNDDIEVTGQNGETNVIEGQKASAITSVPANSTNVLPTQKRSRKPTRRYIDEIVDPILTHSKKRREVSSSTMKDKALRVKDNRKCHARPKAEFKEPPEEFSVIAIQVPFGSLANKECSDSRACDLMQSVDSKNSMTKSKGKCVAAVVVKKRGDCGTGQKKTDGCVAVAPSRKEDGLAAATNQRKRNDCTTIAVIPKKRDDCFLTESQNKMDNSRPVHQKKEDGFAAATNQRKRNDCTTIAVIPKKRDDCFSTESRNKRDNSRPVHQKKRDDSLTAESIEEASGRRKHHKLWTISEVRKLIEGVSQYGVGRWSQIKNLFFSASAHRTSVDLKDKWRNLLKASGMHDRGSEKRRNVAWRPLPKSILQRVCELAMMYPYPKSERETKIALEPAEGSTDMTLSSYRRIIRSIDGN